MGTDDIRDAISDMDIDGFTPRHWLIVAENHGGDILTVWPVGTMPAGMLAEATAAIRVRTGAPGATQ